MSRLSNGLVYTNDKSLTEQADILSELVAKVNDRVSNFAASTEEISASTRVVEEMSKHIQDRLKEIVAM